MKKAFVVFYTTIMSLVYLGAIAYFCGNIYSEYKQGELRTQLRNDTIAVELTKLPETMIPGSDKYNSTLLRAVGSLEDFAYIDIKVNGKQIYIYPANGIKPTDTSSNLIKNFSKSVRNGNYNIAIESSLYLLRPITIYKYARIAFIIILSGTILTIILLILSNLFLIPESSSEETMVVNPKKNKVEYIEPQPEEHIIHEEKTEEVAEATTVENSMTEESEALSENTTVLNDDQQEDETKVSVNAEPDIYESERIIPEVKPEIITMDDKPEEEVLLPVEEVKPMKLEAENPSGLFSPVTGFGWQNYLETRLSNELNRATASEFDLSVFIMKIPALMVCSDELLHDICKCIESEFQFCDLIFEYSEDCFAGIRISMTVDEAIVFAENLSKNLSEILPPDCNDCYIGISSRSIRMVSAKTILHEAQEALNHAVDNGEDNVIAFRADAAKYRRYMELD